MEIVDWEMDQNMKRCVRVRPRKEDRKTDSTAYLPLPLGVCSWMQCITYKDNAIILHLRIDVTSVFQKNLPFEMSDGEGKGRV